MSRTAWYTAIGATLVLVISLTMLMSTSDSQAIVTFAVNSTLDEPDAANDGICSSTPSGVCTLRAAIMQTNELPGMDIIDVPAGDYTLTIAGTTEDDSLTGDLDILDDVKIDGASGIANINADGLDRVFDVDPYGEGLDVEIYDVRVQQGSPPDPEDGGGLRAASSSTNLHVERSFFVGNFTNESGGGLYNAGPLTLVDVQFINNIADYGGGMVHDSLSDATMTNVDFTGNHAAISGGGLYVDTGETTLTNGNFTNNTAFEAGGGAYLADDLTMQTGTFANNLTGFEVLSIAGTLPTDMGGAVYNDTTASTSIDDVTMDNNTSAYGGAIYNVGDFVLTTSTLSSNFADVDGGGILNAALGYIFLGNSTVSGNEAIQNGGGLANYGDLAQMNNVTITRNTADYHQTGAGEGGGIFNHTTIGVDTLISNTIVGSNNYPITSFDCWGSILSAGYNLIGDTTGCTITGDVTGNITNENPNLIDLQNNGGTTLTHRPAAFSPVIDAGSPITGVAGVAPHCEVVDQRGVSRPRDGNGDADPVCDIGAVEVSGPGPTATPFGTPTPTGSPTPTPSPTPSATPTPTETPSTSATPTATQTSIPELEVIWADANCTGAINPVDALVVLRADAGLFASQTEPCVPLGDVAFFDGVQEIWGDFDCNGALLPVDALKILQYDAGFEPAQSSPCPDFGDLVTVTS